MQKDEWISRLEKAASNSQYMSLEDKDYTPTGDEKCFVIGNYALVVKNPEAMRNYCKLTSSYISYCHGTPNGLTLLKENVSDSMVKYPDQNYNDLFGRVLKGLDLFLLKGVDSHFRDMTSNSRYDHSLFPSKTREVLEGEMYKLFNEHIVKNHNVDSFVDSLDLIAFKEYFERYAEYLSKELHMNIYYTGDIYLKKSMELSLSYFLDKLYTYNIDIETRKRLILLAMCIDPFFQGNKLFELYAWEFKDPDRIIYEAAHCIKPDIENYWDKELIEMVESRYANDIDLDSMTSSNIEKLRQIENDIMRDLKCYGITSTIPGCLTAKVHAKIARNDLAQKAVDKIGDKLEQMLENKQQRDFENRRGELYMNSKEGKKDQRKVKYSSEQFLQTDFSDSDSVNRLKEVLKEQSPSNMTDFFNASDYLSSVSESELNKLRKHTLTRIKGYGKKVLLKIPISFGIFVAIAFALCLIRDIPKAITMEQYNQISNIMGGIYCVAIGVFVLISSIYYHSVNKKWKIATVNESFLHPMLQPINRNVPPELVIGTSKERKEARKRLKKGQ